jgi:23S rRNA pseudouridine1911/1915/1917 synthase
MKIPILYEDKDIVVINKPSGLVVHSDGKTKESTVADWVLENYPDTGDVGESMILSSGEEIKRPGIVHRLDRETSGVLIITKNQEAFLNFKKQFQSREIKKIYKAFVHGSFKEEKGVIDRPIGKSKKDFRMWSAQRGARGLMREALTEYKVLDSFKDRSSSEEGYSFVEVYPKTGRTHQIRVHFKAINHQIVCDKLYAPKRGCSLGFERLALHAYSIEFTNLENKKVVVIAELPADFLKALPTTSE